MNSTRMYVPLWVRHPIGVRTRWLSTVDHKEIGVLYMAMALGFFVLGGLEAVAIRIQLAQCFSQLDFGSTFAVVRGSIKVVDAELKCAAHSCPP